MDGTPEHYLPVCLPSPDQATTIPSQAALEDISTSHRNPAKLAEEWGLTLQQVFDIQDGIG